MRRGIYTLQQVERDSNKYLLLQNNNNRVSSTKYKKVNQIAVKYITGKTDIFQRKFW